MHTHGLEVDMRKLFAEFRHSVMDKMVCLFVCMQCPWQYDLEKKEAVWRLGSAGSAVFSELGKMRTLK